MALSSTQLLTPKPSSLPFLLFPPPPFPSSPLSSSLACRSSHHSASQTFFRSLELHVSSPLRVLALTVASVGISRLPPALTSLSSQPQFKGPDSNSRSHVLVCLPSRTRAPCGQGPCLSCALLYPESPGADRIINIYGWGPECVATFHINENSASSSLCTAPPQVALTNVSSWWHKYQAGI